MVVIVPAAQPVDSAVVSLYYAKDARLANSPVFIFLGPSTTTNSTLNSSRIQAHIYSIGGYYSFPRLTVSPTSTIYGAVLHLPDEKQGDANYRALAACLLKYFGELSHAIKDELVSMATASRSDGLVPHLFDEIHAGNLAASMSLVSNADEVAEHLFCASVEKSLSWLDIDVFLPSDSIVTYQSGASPNGNQNKHDSDNSDEISYGKYTDIVEIFGTPAFLPTSTLRRAPSRPTAASKNRTLAMEQIKLLRKEMDELLMTEESYVRKLQDLASCATFECCKSQMASLHAYPAQRHALGGKLFPDSLLEILRLNSDFLDCLIGLMADTDDEVARSQTHAVEQHAHENQSAGDCIGIEKLASILLEHFPRFKNAYQQYLRASIEFPALVTEALRDGRSPLAMAISQTGEQKLRSWLIEPVQRLPRYCLIIDNMTSMLPATHPAMSRFLTVRDILTDICALDNDQYSDCISTGLGLKELCSGWPDNLFPQGRLVTVADAIELRPPYNASTSLNEDSACTLLLFTDSICVLKKSGLSPLSARGLVAELDRLTVARKRGAHFVAQKPAAEKSLAFAYTCGLHDTRFLESNDGHIISLASPRASGQSNGEDLQWPKTCPITHAYLLQGSYENRASRWSEEVAKARIESRFSENVRDSSQWHLRSISPRENTPGIFAAITTENENQKPGEKKTYHVQIKVLICDSERKADDAGNILGSDDVETVVYIVPIQNDYCSVEFKSIHNYHSVDKIQAKDFHAVFFKRLTDLQRWHSKPLTHDSARVHILEFKGILDSAKPYISGNEGYTRRFRPVSPVKVLSSLFGGSFKETGSLSRHRLPVSSSFSAQEIPPLTTVKTLRSRANSKTQIPEKEERSKVTLVDGANLESRNTISQLESTFGAYMIALRSRCGNVVGKILKYRGSADELSVNDLYNILIESPTQLQAAAEVPIDVLFSAFENFLSKAWRERMGPILSSETAEKMRVSMNCHNATLATEQFKMVITELSPQNQRALVAMVRLLSELLDASGNDGDRGALMAAFADALNTGGSIQSYLSLLDRFVEDFEDLFEVPLSRTIPSTVPGPNPGQRARSVNTGSLSSNASSLRKRFGFATLSRENSKTDAEPRVGNMWRGLGKKAGGDSNSQPSSLSKAFLSRTWSTTDGSHQHGQNTFQKGSSSPQHAPTELGSRPGSAHNTISTLNIIGERASEESDSIPKRKRRSSLSDLRDLQKLGVSSFHSTTAARRMDPIPSSARTLQTEGTVLNLASPTKGTYATVREESLRTIDRFDHKENSLKQQRNTLTERAVNRKPDEVVVQRFSPKKVHSLRGGSTSGIRGLEEKSTINGSYPSIKKPSSPQKLKVQSPQKLRERLQNEMTMAEEARQDLRTELLNIGKEISSAGIVRHGPNTVTAEMNTIRSRVSTLENQLETLGKDQTKRALVMRNDVESSLAVSESKCKSLDELYQEANAENEALYERFNTELERVLAAVRNGHGIEETKTKLKEAQNEAERLRKENQRLKRENLGLRSQLRS